MLINGLNKIINDTLRILVYKKIFSKNLEKFFFLNDFEIIIEKFFGDVSSKIFLNFLKFNNNFFFYFILFIKNFIGIYGCIKKIKIEFPAYLNLYIDKYYIFRNHLNFSIFIKNDKIIKKNKKVLIEFVSCNPTGDIHLGHARNFFFGKFFFNLLLFYNYNVSSEFYINDKGSQIQQFLNIVFQKYSFFFLKEINVVNNNNEYLKLDVNYLIQNLIKNYSFFFLLNNYYSTYIFNEVCLKINLNKINLTLTENNFIFNKWFKESFLYKSFFLNKFNNFIYFRVNKKNNIFRDRILLFKDFFYLKFKNRGIHLFFLDGDYKKKTIFKTNGNPTYFLGDILYNYKKKEMNFDKFVNVLGFDHFDHINKLKKILFFLNFNIKKIEFITVQIVNLRDFNNNQIKISKRLGNIIYLSDAVKYLGYKILIFFFTYRSNNSFLSFNKENKIFKNESKSIDFIIEVYKKILFFLKENLNNKNLTEYYYYNFKEKQILETKISIFLICFYDFFIIFLFNRSLNLVNDFVFNFCKILNEYIFKYFKKNKNTEYYFYNYFLLSNIKKFFKIYFKILDINI